MSDPLANLSVKDTTGKTAEPSVVSEKSIGDFSDRYVPEGGNVNVSHADTVSEGVDVNPSVKATLDGLKDSTPSGRDVLRPSADDSVKDTVAEGINVDIPSVVDIELVTTKATGEEVIPSVTDTCAETAEGMERPTVGQEHEPQGENAQEDVHDLDTEDVAAVMSRRRKAKEKLRMNDNRIRVGNTKVPKNVVTVPTTNVTLNFEEEQAKWRLVVNRRVAAKKMLSELTKKNANIINILEGARVMPTVEVVGPYYPKLVKEFVCNMTGNN
ncbi:hypothetical protein LIER_34976 [Lithospermum erythrorhizon]|uniref:Uncharacterized protein n=1 Tax=Lithospermum erythrorhizon TaxID=34254 RepID=A0AAV3NIZ7_LITER